MGSLSGTKMKEGSDIHEIVTDLISVIVPVYNGEKYLSLCGESIINQSYKNIEIILINDGSTDGSGKICDAFALGDNRIRVIHAKNNGPAAARNIGMECARGEFIFFIDADDFIEKNALELLVENYHETKADIIVGDFKSIHNNIPGPGHKGAFADDKLLLKQDIISYARCYLKRPNRFTLFAYSWGRLYKSAIIKDNHINFNPNLFTYEDVAFNYDYFKHSSRVYYCKAAIYNHVFHDHYMSATMMMSGDPIKLFGYMEALDTIRDYLQDNIAMADINREIGHAYVSLTIIQLVRACGQVNASNRKTIHNLVRDLTDNPKLRHNLRYYSPSKGDSRMIPILMKLKLVLPIIWVCRYKAYKRYGKGAAAK